MYLPDCDGSAEAGTATAATTADAFAGDDGDHRRHIGICDAHAAVGNRTGEGCVVFSAASTAAGTAGTGYKINLILAGLKMGDDQRLVDLGAAACAKGKGFAAGVARTGHADGECARRTALIAARLKEDLMDDQRGAVFIFGAAQMCGIAKQRMCPLGEGTVGRINAFAAALRLMMMTPEHRWHLRNVYGSGLPKMAYPVCLREALQG